MNEDEDLIKRGLKARAAACLDHVRLVKWGSATAAYVVEDGDLRVDVSIQISCFSKAGQPK